tara:strand:- start:603 stop:1388 length:786 start_codon:yes stop_codon:yes gene_type:complete
MKLNKVLSIENISYQVDEKIITNQITLDINASDMVTIIGPNGSGKTTLLRLISNDIIPTSGNIIFQNKNLKEWSSVNLAKERASLSQNSYISFPFTVFEVIQMGRFPFTERNNEKEKIINKVIDMFHLNMFVNRNYTTLSGGEKQRVQLARVIAQIYSKKHYNNKLLILDEPTSFLDIKHQIQLFETLKTLRDKGLTIIMVLHDINQAISNSNKIIMLKEANLIHFGKTSNVINSKNLEDVFDVKLHLSDVNSKDLPLVHM